MNQSVAAYMDEVLTRAEELRHMIMAPRTGEGPKGTDNFTLTDAERMLDRAMEAFASGMVGAGMGTPRGAKRYDHLRR